MVNDPIADYLTRIRNAQERKQEVLTLPATNMLVSISDILKKTGFIESFELVDGELQKELKLTLKYINEMPAIRSLKRVSKPGLRKYISYKDVPKVLSGKGISILSTPQGVLTGDDAKKNKVGGEYICEIW